MCDGFGINIITNNIKSYWIVLMLIVIISLSQAVEINNPFGYTKTELTKDDYEILMWMKNNVHNTTIAATWQVSGVWINSIAQKRTILGAFQESIQNYDERRSDLKKIFTSTNKAEIENIMNKYNAGYIFVNNYEERGLYNGVTERLRAMFSLVIENDYAHVFKI